ncbi:MAG: class I SAM-dependent methyltransferase family protein [Nanoarchaeota archaeon]|nr:class I SAM-dependent methyltransferase family protein [Nanoarchaeota archaeon]MBU1975694.1 class I SAM-dependent methyltransferase family protein [Nanoarchaeota archaeon]
MLTIKAPLKDAQKVKSLLLEKGLLDERYQLKKTKTDIFLPIVKRFNTAYKITEVKLEKREPKQDLKSRLSETLSKQEMTTLKTSMDTVGDIAIIELDSGLEKKGKRIAEEFLKQSKSIKTVLKKKGSHEGEFRVQKYEYLAGDKKFETIHVENNCRIMLDVNKVYFSMRLATERKRIMQHVKKGERILVMFSGCAPYPCVLSKNTEANEIIGIEINPEGHEYGLENVGLNKLKNVRLHCGDVKKIVPKLEGTFDRILMPLPRTAEDFLDTALSVAKKGTIIHFYNFQKQDEFHLAAKKAEKACKKAGFKCKILRTVKCGQHSPRFFRICVDFEVK